MKVLTVAEFLSKPFVQTFLSVPGYSIDFYRTDHESDEPYKAADECPSLMMNFAFMTGVNLYRLMLLMGNIGYHVCYITQYPILNKDCVSILFAHASCTDIPIEPSWKDGIGWVNTEPYVDHAGIESLQVPES